MLMLAFVTGPVRSGKSTAALALAFAAGAPVVMAVGGRSDDPEMARRIARHRAGRPADVRVIETAGYPDWLDDVSPDVCLLVDCLGTILGGVMLDAPGDPEPGDADGTENTGCTSEETEAWATARADALVDALIVRPGPTVVVSNEVGWGVVPAFPSGRLFRDLLGRENRRLADAADRAWLIVAGRAIDLTALGQELRWPYE